MKYVAWSLPLFLAGCNVPLPNVSSNGDWDRPVNPDGDCRFAVSQSGLSIQVPGRDHDLGVERGVMNAPRWLRDVNGDFTAQVVVAGDFQPTVNATTPERASFNGAGLVLMADDQNYVRLERAAMVKNGNYSGHVNWELRRNGQTAPTGWDQYLPLQNTPTYLRLVRRGNRLAASVSQDGARWTDITPIDVPWPARVKIGVDAVSTSAAPFQPHFNDFRLTTP